MTIRIEIPGNPVCKGRPRFGRRGAYTPAKTRAAESVIKLWLARFYQEPPCKQNVIMDIEFYLCDNRRRDIDNLGKLVLDACNGKLYADDNQIIDLRLRKHVDKDYPHTIIEMRIA